MVSFTASLLKLWVNGASFKGGYEVSVSFAYVKELVGILRNIPECKDDAVWLLDTHLVWFEGEDYIIFREASEHQRFRNFYNCGEEFVPDLLVQLQQILGNDDDEDEDQMFIDTPSLPKGEYGLSITFLI